MLDISFGSILLAILGAGVLVAAVLQIRSMRRRAALPGANALLCPRCTYEVFGLAAHRCPECGADLSVTGVIERRFRGRSRQWALLFLLLSTGLLSIVLALIASIRIGGTPAVMIAAQLEVHAAGTERRVQEAVASGRPLERIEAVTIEWETEHAATHPEGSGVWWQQLSPEVPSKPAFPVAGWIAIPDPQVDAWATVRVSRPSVRVVVHRVLLEEEVAQLLESLTEAFRLAADRSGEAADQPLAVVLGEESEGRAVRMVAAPSNSFEWTELEIDRMVRSISLALRPSLSEVAKRRPRSIAWIVPETGDVAYLAFQGRGRAGRSILRSWMPWSMLGAVTAGTLIAWMLGQRGARRPFLPVSAESGERR